MAFAAGLVAVFLYALIALMLFVGIGLALGGDEGGVVGFILCVIIAGYGAGYVAPAGLFDRLFGMQR